MSKLLLCQCSVCTCASSVCLSVLAQIDVLSDVQVGTTECIPCLCIYLWDSVSVLCLQGSVHSLGNESKHVAWNRGWEKGWQAGAPAMAWPAGLFTAQ